jgi:chemotaxis signal transduction protein
LGVDEPAPGRAALVLRRPGRPAALAVQSVDEIRTLRREDLQPPSGNMVLVKGIDSNLVALLDVEEIAKETAR